MNNLIYLGEHLWSKVECDFSYRDNSCKYKVVTNKSHIFYDINNNQYFDIPDFNYVMPVLLNPNSNIYNGVLNSFNSSTEFKFGYKKIEIDPPRIQRYSNRYIIKSKQKENTFELINYRILGGILTKCTGYFIEGTYEISEDRTTALKMLSEPRAVVLSEYDITLEEFLKLDFYELFVEDNKGNQIKIKSHKEN